MMNSRTRPEIHYASSQTRADLARRWTVEELARDTHLSASRLWRLFVEELGVIPLGLLTRLRVREMARILRETRLPVREVAQAVGRRDQAHAAQQFRKLTGRSPTDYRTEARSRTVAECLWCGRPLPSPSLGWCGA